VEGSASTTAVSLVRSKFWGGAKPKVDKIDIFTLADGKKADRLFEKGRLHLGIDIKQASEKLTRVPTFESVLLMMNVKRKPFANPIFRRAFAMSIDRGELAKFTALGFRPFSALIPPGILGYESNRGVRFDPATSKKLFEESGHKISGQTLRLSLGYADFPGAVRVSESIRTQAKALLNIDIDISQSQDPEKFDIYLVSRTGGYPDAHAYTQFLTSSAPENIYGWKNKKYDDWVRDAAVEKDPEERVKLYSKIQHLASDEEIPMMTLLLDSMFFLVSSDVSGFTPNAIGDFSFLDVKLK
jgi:ABC-type transport system substrate-binding protein